MKLDITQKKDGLSRRDFIYKSALSLAGLAFFSCENTLLEQEEEKIAFTGDTPGALEENGSRKEILIIGAGLSGLVAAYELSRVGHKVKVLEARERCGGRVYTRRSEFSSGLFAEAGASRIPIDHSYTIAYAEHFDLELDPFYANTGDYFYLSNTNRSLESAASFLQKRPWPSSVRHSEYSKLRAGSDHLPKAFASILSDKVQLSKAVKTVIQTDENLTIITASGEQYTADYLICTVPLPVLNQIDFSPKLSDEKINAAAGAYDYSASNRVFMQFSDRSWENENLNAWGNTNLPEEIWHPSWDMNEEKALVLSYLRYAAAENLDLLSETDRIEAIMSRIRLALPSAEAKLETAFSHSWKEEKWSKGAWANPSSAQHFAFANHIGKSEGRIYFAGEHLSNYHGWMQGALISGSSTAREVHSQAAIS